MKYLIITVFVGVTLVHSACVNISNSEPTQINNTVNVPTAVYSNMFSDSISYNNDFLKSLLNFLNNNAIRDGFNKKDCDKVLNYGINRMNERVSKEALSYIKYNIFFDSLLGNITVYGKYNTDTLLKMNLIYIDSTLFVYKHQNAFICHIYKKNLFIICKSNSYDRIVSIKNLRTVFFCENNMYPIFSVKFYPINNKTYDLSCYQEYYDYSLDYDGNFHATRRVDSLCNKDNFIAQSIYQLWDFYKKNSKQFSTPSDDKVLFPNGYKLFTNKPMWLEPASVVLFI